MKRWSFFWALLLSVALPVHSFATAKPNIVILIADDMGWRDTGYSGNHIVKTPTLDNMAAGGIRFDYFYVGGPICCPGRYAILTGRTPLRGGITGGEHIREEEVILPRALKFAGYNSAYFGKWHLGYDQTAPIGMGFDQAIWSPGEYGIDPTFMINDTKTTIQMKGDSSLAIMDVTLGYIRTHAQNPNPFLVMVGFSAPHDPWHASPEFKALYKNVQGKDADYWGEISAMDTAVGKLRAELRKTGIAENTLVWFTSDNAAFREQSRDPTGRGKGSVGVRTVSVLEWPGHTQKPKRVLMPCGHVDMYPTLLDLAGAKFPQQPIVDGISLVPLLEASMTQRPKPLGFMLWDSGDTGLVFPHIDFVENTQGIWIDGKYELIIERVGSKEYGGRVRLYDIFQDPALKNNLAYTLPKLVLRMRKALNDWKRSVHNSYEGADFALKVPEEKAQVPQSNPH